MKPLKVVEAGVVPYEVALEWQRLLHRQRVEDEIPDLLLLLQHPHVYTLGRRFDKEHLLLGDEVLKQRGIQLHEADRGGSITYHGPGQLVGYPIVDLRRGDRGHPSEQPDAIRYLRQLEEAIIRTVRAFGVIATRREGRTGVWVGDGKLAAIGVNVTRGVTKHGLAINVAPDLTYFEGIVPCGIPGARATSLEELLGKAPDIAVVAQAVASNLARILHRVAIPGDLSALDLPGVPAVLSGDGLPGGGGGTVVDFPTKPAVGGGWGEAGGKEGTSG